MMSIFLREWLGPRTFPREPEPALVMNDEEQTRAYNHAGGIDGVMSAAYLFHTARISQVIAGRRRVLDLGCGPAIQLLQVAELNPAVAFTGVDLSGKMLERARENIATRLCRNVAVREDDVTRLATVADGSVDAVISTMALHHLPTYEQLRECFSQIARVLEPGGAIYLADFGRLKSLRSVLYFAYQNAPNQPHVFSLDYERSLRAAFLPDEFQRALEEHLPSGTALVATFKVPFLILIKSRDGVLDREVRSRLHGMRNAMLVRYRRDLDDLRVFFKWGGLTADPFDMAPLAHEADQRDTSVI